MKANRGVCLLVGAVLLVGCGAEEGAEATEDGVLGEALQVELGEPSEEREALVLPAYCNDVISWNSTWASMESQVLSLVNQRRAAGATCGGVVKAPAPALTFDERLRCAARKHSKDMGVNNFFSHTGSNGSTFVQRITSAGYTPYTALAENIAAGQTTASGVVNAWMASTGHCNNIMNPNYRHLGVGYSYGGTSTYKHYWTADFGKQ
jgi:uncharacterized protein YkwD